MGNVLHLSSTTALDSAWAEYQAHMLRGLDNPRLFIDREWVNKRAVLHRRYERLFHLQERER